MNNAKYKHIMASKDGIDKFTNRDMSFIAFCDELRAYVEEHHLFSAKHHRLLNKCKYVKRKINEGTLEDWKREMFEEIANSRDLSILTDGRKKESKDLTFNNLISVEIA